MSDGVTQPTQTATQTQLLSQHQYVEDTSDLWGFLIPCNASNPYISRINFHKTKLTYAVGRGPHNDIHFPKCPIVSNKHCVIQWDGVDDPSTSAVTVTDYSSNGTFINCARISEPGTPRKAILHDGSEIAFGAYVPQDPEKAHVDYRFIFRKTRPGAPADTLDESYDIQHVLGRGSFATVVKALHRTEGQWYAVKIVQKSRLRKGIIDDGQETREQRAVLREIDIMKRLHHEYICRYKDVFIEENSMSLVMEYVEGGDLLGWLQDHDPDRPPSEKEVQYFTYQICEALHYVHELDIAHRDLKLENILLTKDDPPVIKIADFGLAKMIDSVTFLHTMCGTPEYLAPEVVTNSAYDKVVDSWSVGVIVFSLLTMRTPFIEVEGATDVVTQVTNRQIEWSLLQTRKVTEHGQEFIRELLKYNPEERMTLTDARNHAWLADQKAAYEATQDQPVVSQPSQDTSVEFPPETQEDSQALSTSFDVSMRSLTPGRVVPDGTSIVMNAESQTESIEEARAASEASSRAATLAHVLAEDAYDLRALPSSQLEDAGAGAAGEDFGSRPHPVQRRADIIRRAHHRGIRLPAPSQDMQARAAAELDTVAGDPAHDAAEPEGVENVGSSRMLVPASAAVVARPSKRKAVELDSDPASAPLGDSNGGDDEGEGALGRSTSGTGSGAKKTRRGTRAAKRSPSTKKARTGRSSPTPSDDQEVSEPTIGRRRSSRLASPTKLKSAHKT
ncbi:kinase-like protein [Dichomitus squalens LYAD-421 SS1]|uniref:Kinase-like protein n=1 Tax=Dichomitus squalens (strain LYAD-421) TaxID=732165 RepID=R7SQN5_DICSQ|nr:kinase-like protein [Dichomitus squalens LYAD-421 SS1]EJF58075.1 kinase-like protein [Dichomitus squalens LYAD-421 SS1]